MEFSIGTELKFISVECADCGVPFALTARLHKEMKNSHRTFFCPHGHHNYYPGETEAEKLRKELKRKEQEVADEVIRRLNTEDAFAKAERKLKRIHNGTCPCCKRSFKNLQRHMQSKHPEQLK